MWKNYLSNILEDDCLVVALLNIKYFLQNRYKKNIAIYNRDTDDYKKLVALSRLEDKTKLYKKLGLKVAKKYKSLWDVQHKEIRRKNKIMFKEYEVELPLLVRVYHKAYGLHYIALVDYEPKTDCWMILNFKMATSLEGWIFSEDLYHYLRIGEEGISLFDLK